MAKITNITYPLTGEPAKPSRQPSKAARKKVRNAFDAEMLVDLCARKDFSAYGKLVELPGEDRFYYYQDNGSDILAIAHLDSVQSDVAAQITDTAAGLLVTSGALDDRLGVYVILELLPQLGITCDWLLTTDEEICRPTSEDFETDKDYNWMFSFDRGGTDVVMYQYDTKERKELVENAGAQVGRGTFSDIAVLDHLQCAGFNWGVGYEDYHGPRSHAWLEDTFKMVARFVKFYHANAATPMAHVPCYKPATTTSHYYSSGSGMAWSWDDPTDDDDKDAPNEDAEWIEADCGHDVDINDPTTYVDIDITLLVCAAPECLRAAIDGGIAYDG